jgi:hypothetical protein
MNVNKRKEQHLSGQPAFLLVEEHRLGTFLSRARPSISTLVYRILLLYTPDPSQFYCLFLILSV